MPRSPDPWQVIEALAETPATLYEWRWRLGPFFDAAVPFLKPADAGDDIYVPCTQCMHPALALPDAIGGFTAAHDPTSPCTHAVTLTQAEAAARELDPVAFGKAAAELLHLVPPVPEDTISNAMLIGFTARPTRMPVFLLIQPDFAAYRSATLALLARHTPPFVLITATPRESMRQVCEPLRVHLFDAPNLMTWSPEGLVGTGRRIGNEIALHAGSISGTAATLYCLRRGAGCWIITMAGEAFPVSDQKGLLYVAYLLRSPPTEPIHALTLGAAAEELPEDARSTVTDDETGRALPIEAAAVLQQLNLSKDDQRRLHGLHRKYGELLHALDDPNTRVMDRDQIESDLSDTDAEIRSIMGATRDAAGKKADAIRRSIGRLCDSLRAIPGSEPTAASAQTFAGFVETHILNPSARYGRSLRSKQAGHPAGCFVYEPPPGVVWT